ISLSSCGNVYRFVRPGGIWMLQSTITASDVDSGYGFGESVALSKNGLRAVVGASGADCPTGNCGAAYVYDDQGGVLVERGRVTSPTAGTGGSGLGGAFGDSVALSGDGTVMLVAARLEDCAAGQDCGAVYVYSLPPN
ncbi:MAG: FG-GAP repeat protein, partial [Gammaproteobacteria bacterium]